MIRTHLPSSASPHRAGGVWSWLWAIGFACGVAFAIYLMNVSNPGTAIAAGLLYLASHLFRAARLAALSVSLLGISARAAGAAHFATAPFGILLPLKLGEIVRFGALWSLSGRGVNSLIVLLIDRMFDSLFLLPILLTLAISNDASAFLMALTVLLAFVPLMTLVVGPRFLAELQRYLIIHPAPPISDRGLRMIDRLRRITVQASKLAWRLAAPLCLVSFLVWLCELLFCLILVQGIIGASELLGTKLVAFWAAPNLDPVLAKALVITIVAQLLPWPIMAISVIKMHRQRILMEKPKKVLG